MLSEMQVQLTTKEIIDIDIPMASVIFLFDFAKDMIENTPHKTEIASIIAEKAKSTNTQCGSPTPTK